VLQKTSTHIQDNKKLIHIGKKILVSTSLTLLLRFLQFGLGLGELILQILDIVDGLFDRDGLGNAVRFSGKQSAKLINRAVYSTSTGLFSHFVASSTRFDATRQFLWIGKTKLTVIALEDVLVIRFRSKCLNNFVTRSC
jgi:hypothetical protein